MGKGAGKLKIVAFYDCVAMGRYGFGFCGKLEEDFLLGTSLIILFVILLICAEKRKE